MLGRFPRLAVGAALGLVLAAAATSCLDATAVRVHLYTDVPWAAGRDIAVFAHSSEGAFTDPVVAIQEPWTSTDVGDVALVPSDSRSAPIRVLVAMGVTRPSSQCTPQAPDGCIFVRRRLGFVEHKTLTVPIIAYARCIGVVCDEKSTCSSLGQCVSADLASDTCGGDGCLLAGETIPVTLAANVADAGVDAAAAPADDGGVPVVPGFDAGTPFISCAGLAKNCSATADQDCCASYVVVGGTFDRSSDAGAPATVSDFDLDAYEVTVGRFRAFVNAGLGTQASPPAPGLGAHPNLPSTKWDPTWSSALAADTASLRASLQCDAKLQTWGDDPTQTNLPITCTTWYEAFAFCAWDGGWLPTEADWNYAAAGGSVQRPYPWGTDVPDTSHAVYSPAAPNAPTGPTLIAPVGSKSPLGDGLFGQSDLAGNAYEWVMDSFGPYDTPCVDCVQSTGTRTNKVIRGGSAGSGDVQLFTGDRVSQQALDRTADYLGFRCARPAGPLPSSAKSRGF